MRIRCLFAQRKESYLGEFGPELLAAIDEYTLEENPEAFTQECEKQLRAMEADCLGHVYMWIVLGSDVQGLIRASCLHEQSLNANLKDVEFD